MSRPPNILWLVTDHQALANRPEVARQLPLQRRLAERGTRFNRAYTVLPVCSPSRASMLTGALPHRHGLTENDGRFGGRAGLEPEDWLVHHPLLEAGYRCGWFGKWHLNQTRAAADFGFEGFSLPDYGYPFGTAEYAAYLAREGLEAPLARIELPGESGRGAGARIDLTAQTDWWDYESGTAVLDGPAEAHEAFFAAGLARDWLGALDPEEPFFLRVDTWGPHPPYLVAEPFADLFGDVETAASANLEHDLRGRPSHHIDYQSYWRRVFVEGADDFALLSRRALQQAALCETALLGVLDALEASGQAENTLVVFCADHGDAVASNGGVGNKGGLMVEETLRIPMLVAGPGVQRQEVETLVSNVDLVPTLLQACGCAAAPFADGQSLLPLLRGGDGPDREGILCEHYGLNEPAVQRAWLSGMWKLVVQEDGFTELYDLASDPAEMDNLAGQSAHSARLSDLQRGMIQAMERSGDTGTAVFRALAGAG